VKLLELLGREYPQITWTAERPEPTITANYGDGFILKGVLGRKKKEFFILNEDKQGTRWGDIIAAQLYGVPIEEEQDATEYTE